MKRHSQQGVALIITLILLAVVTVMAVAFLASSRRERGAVTTTTDTASARLAADAALAQAEAQVMANTLATTNPYNFGFLVSTNYIPPLVNPPNPSVNDLTNMLISPRAPVWLSNNVTGFMENRFYLDLNRNGVDETNGWITNVDNSGNIIFSGGSATNLQVGDPEWIGVLDHPDQPHGPNNRFIARYAFVAVPIGNALDLNAIYDQAKTKEVDQPTGGSAGVDGFMRNQGIGSWEINLAAFLADLNTNQWDNSLNQPYNYFEPGSANTGLAFEDALSLLSYRYGFNYNSLFSADNLFALAPTVFPFDNIDGYSDGPLQTTLNTNEFLFADKDNPKLPWAGSDNTNHFFDMQELFNTSETAVGVSAAQITAGNDFSDRLLTAGKNNSTYNRYTFYRLLSQLGTDSAPEQNKMNLNYDNLDLGLNGVLNANGTASATNYVPWTALGFFTNAADRMLRAYSQDWLARDPSNYLATYFYTNGAGMTTIPLISITNIPVYVNGANVYSSAIQRVLQLAANMYDATTNTFFPSVFRPFFWRTNNDVYIGGFVDISTAAILSTNGTSPLDLPVDVTNLSLTLNARVNDANGNVYGVPWIIGAKKGFPNFNEFSMESMVGITRRLQVTRTATNQPPPTPLNLANFHTNEMYTMTITNQLGAECWNSYASNYLDSVQIVVRDKLSGALTNDDGMADVLFNDNINNMVNPVNWPGIVPWNGAVGVPNTNSFDIPLLTSVPIPLSTFYTPNTNWWIYRFNDSPPDFIDIPPTPNLFETNINGFPFPHFGLLTTNRLQVFMLDGNHVIDYAQFAGPDSSRDLNTEIVFKDVNDSHGVWNTNLSASSSTLNVPNGVLNQIQVSKGILALPSEDGQWNDPTKPQQEAFFAAFFNPGNKALVPGRGYETNNPELIVQAPYSPTRFVVHYATWQANDPLVHYLAGDLNYTGASSGGMEPGTNIFDPPGTIPGLTALNLGRLNDHYAPWGGNPVHPPNPNTPDDPNVLNAQNLAIKDPLISFSDNWDFPTNKMPTVGWLGRVHRGTPWQTVYLKSSLPNINNWATNWTGDLNAFDANNSSPGEDRQLFDLFSTAANDNATRGQLSVNVGASDPNNLLTGLAAWSALFSGVVVPTNTIGGYTVVQPAGAAGASSFLGQLVTNINATRLGYTNVYGLPAFEHVGDVLASPYLTVSNQWLLQNNNTNINDEMYEWLPQQTMSLLRVSGTPQSPMRYVIYCYGQTLKPAQNGIVTSGLLFGICTNYQVVAEAATRSVVQFNSTRRDNIFQTNYPPNVNLIWTNVPSVPGTNAVVESFNVLPPN